MPLILEQGFLQGCFHATRWNQSPFEDPFGEWPPSPWRLLRALTARWHQYLREHHRGTGEISSVDENLFFNLLAKLAAEQPSYHLPEAVWRGRPIKQYQPTALDWTDRNKAAPAVRKSSTTLIEDHFWIMDSEQSIYWFWDWDDVSLESEEITLLDALLERILYFGRAESACRFKRIISPLEGIKPNCHLSDRLTSSGRPVLVVRPDPDQIKEALTAVSKYTDDKLLEARDLPPGTAWYYAHIPPISKARPVTSHPKNLTGEQPRYFVQFAVGGRVFPPSGSWIRLASRFRGRVIKNLCRLHLKDNKAHYGLLDSAGREEISLISGKDAYGRRLEGHPHAYFAFWPDEDYLPTRLIVWRRFHPFKQEEIHAIFQAAASPLRLEGSSADWSIAMVPLPWSVPIPNKMVIPTRYWRSVTPFVPPIARHRFRKNGRARPGENIEHSLSRLLISAGYPVPSRINIETTEWTKLHLTRRKHMPGTDPIPAPVGLGSFLDLEFDQPVAGPLALGESCHFGLGLFMNNDS
ncbi:MAG: type I-U CRISPR-associated protein Cas5/Cas6 [Deltaproteobacteria bacterium]|nr:type I-U CRISPR-associated protein Cas5/Cas6 [Deltaproteobacteria bacterium]